MSTFHLRIVTPDGVAFDQEASSLSLHATDGELCIQPDHADLVSTVEVSLVKIVAGEQTKYAACSSGFLTVSHNKVTFVATTFEFSENIDLKRAEEAKKRAEAILESKADDKNFALAEMKLKRAIARIQASQQKGEIS